MLARRVLQANDDHVKGFEALVHAYVKPPAKRAAFLMCMDARVSPDRFAGIRQGDAHIVSCHDQPDFSAEPAHVLQCSCMARPPAVPHYADARPLCCALRASFSPPAASPALPLHHGVALPVRALQIRNAGGRASDDAIRSLVISHKLLGTSEFFVIHHTDCGMEFVTGDRIGQLLENDLSTAVFDGKTFQNRKEGGGSPEGHYMNWLTIADQHASIKEDVLRIVGHPLVNKSLPVHGYLYNLVRRLPLPLLYMQL